MSYSQEPSILIVDDEQHLLDSLSLTLRTRGHQNVLTSRKGSKALSLIQKHFCPVVLLDLFMPDTPGEEILARICAEHPHTAVIIITGINEVETAVRCIRAGALDYLVKPVEPDNLLAAVDRALKHSALLLENRRLRHKLLHQELQKPEAFEHILTRSREIQAVFNYMEAVAPARDPLLITGETGTGKDLLARSLHMASERKGELVRVNTAGLDEHMFSDVLFGHVRGAFTDARQARAGLVEQARGGTLFLDEIGDLPSASQVKLLHLIQDREYLPLGADKPRRADVRIVAATNRDLQARVLDGVFRQDLFYRLSTYHVHLPPLRQRPRDIPLLAAHFLDEALQDLNQEQGELTPRVIKLLQEYDFPGNIRELRGIIYDGLARGGVAGIEEKLASLTGCSPDQVPGADTLPDREIIFPSLLPTLEETVQALIQEALKRSGGNQARAAGMLGISKQALNQRLKKTK
ncbi:sigma-54 dependent transcriptional regulator [Desulfonatronospira sp.]|uniref:sigma-54-dependent transcriptional regulator n=1 Tax=Desulfonatronospira sp. TaxID=1962951 RepID=UPI0025C0454D|nr:sigma-54 dependent transcriptional regulator [Desulfonatronospira sp.]